MAAACRLALAALLLPAAAAGPSCVVVRDAANAQNVKIEAHGDNAVRVRAVPASFPFKDDPDVISALSPLPSAAGARHALAAECATVTLDSVGGPTSVTSGNIRAAVGADGRLIFTRVSDSKVLLTEKAVRALAPTVTVPPVPGFLSLHLSFEAVEGERIYGLGQHAAFAWDKSERPTIPRAARAICLPSDTAANSQSNGGSLYKTSRRTGSLTRKVCRPCCSSRTTVM